MGRSGDRPDKQTDGGGRAGGEHTVVTKGNLQHHMIAGMVYVACLTLLSLITLIMRKYMLAAEIPACAISVKDARL